ncbi:vesicle-fusing ATPase 1-like isoform X1 [Cryptotermes secundus]|uniref:vesicle-fusing ATPase 1-like isoform X1 n=1 Tax=Cryptotermes secundus TaxID=105785 RepID=UPI000CD7CC85|nr:vesicle-fusing ATPase 1-like isoform X1 [Cryptotermes secundus]
MKHFLISDRNENTSAPSTSGGIEATRSMKTRRKVLQDLGILSAFRAILHVPNISQAKHLMVVLERSSVFSKDDLSSIYHKIHGHRVFIGMKKLLDLIGMVRQVEEQNRVVTFLTNLEDFTKLSEEELGVGSPRN